MYHSAENATVFLDYTFPAIRAFGSHGYSLPILHRLVGAVKCDCVRVVASGPFVLVATEILNFALLTGQLAFFHVEFPLTAKRIIPSPKGCCHQAGKRE